METTKMSRPGLLQRTFLYIQRHGVTRIPARIWTGLKKKPSFNIGILLSYPIHPDMALPVKPEGIDVVRLAADDEETLQTMATIAQHEMSNALENYQKRIPGGEICYTVRVDGELAAYVWMAIRDSVSTTLGGRFVLKPDEVYLYDAYTLEAYRGKRFYPYLKAYACREVAREHGRRFAVSLVRYNNRSSLNASKKLGTVKRLGYIGVLRIMGYRLNFRWPPSMRERQRG